MNYLVIPSSYCTYSSPHVPQVVFYQSGVGTWGDKVIEQLDGRLLQAVSCADHFLNSLLCAPGIVGASLGMYNICRLRHYGSTAHILPKPIRFKKDMLSSHSKQEHSDYLPFTVLIIN